MKKDNTNKIVIISIKTYYAMQIFNKTKIYEFRKSPIKKDLLDKKIYVYSSKEDKAIIGYFKVSDILNGNTNEILKATGYDLRKDGREIIDYFGNDNQNCFALHLYDATAFREKLYLSEMRSISMNLVMPQYIRYIYENDPLYNVIKEWDDAFGRDGNIIDPIKMKQDILKKAKMKGKK